MLETDLAGNKTQVGAPELRRGRFLSLDVAPEEKETARVLGEKREK